MVSMKTAVARGAKLLDKELPGWARHIKLRSLFMGRYQDCIVGQLELHYHFAGNPKLDPFSISKGFDQTGPSSNYKILTDLWKDQVRARR